MSPLDYAWIALGFLLFALVGAVAGALATVKAFLIMHENSLPPDYRSKNRRLAASILSQSSEK
ncbi:hypothetical protein IFT43_14905 [Oxalobacteraceae sp. CFBP 13708]|nr:hypothetical protein [Oxalobacteraceae sp. CFBP 13708]